MKDSKNIMNRIQDANIDLDLASALVRGFQVQYLEDTEAENLRYDLENDFIVLEAKIEAIRRFIDGANDILSDIIEEAYSSAAPDKDNIPA